MNIGLSLQQGDEHVRAHLKRTGVSPLIEEVLPSSQVAGNGQRRNHVTRFSIVVDSGVAHTLLMRKIPSPLW